MRKLLQMLRDNAGKERTPPQLVLNAAAGDATLYIYDVIDPWWGVAALDVAKTIAGLDPAITLHARINSPGGDVFEGRAIRTAIAQHPGKTIAHIDGLAASAATTVVDGADEVEISEGGFYMIHNGWTLALGNRHEMKKTHDLLEKVDNAIVADYAKRTGQTSAQIAQWMDDETWFTAEQAIEHGFVNRLATLPDKKTSNRAWNLAAFANAPKALLEPVEPPPEPDYAAHRAHNERRLRLLQIA
jgi:ATP-dependent Clp protease protease subunit